MFRIRSSKTSADAGGVGSGEGKGGWVGERGSALELSDRRDRVSSVSELEGAVDGRPVFRGRGRFVGDAREAEIFRSRVGSFQDVDGDSGEGLIGSGGTGMMTGSECWRRGFAASLLTRKSACSSTSMHLEQKSAKYLSSGSVCFEGWKFCVRE